MRYFAKIHNDHWQAKNKLERAWQEHCRTNECIILESEAQRDAYVYEMLRKATALCDEHPRCAPLKWSNWTTKFDDSVQFLGVSGVCTMAIWKEKQPQP